MAIIAVYSSTGRAVFLRRGGPFGPLVVLLFLVVPVAWFAVGPRAEVSTVTLLLLAFGDNADLEQRASL